MDNTVSNKTLVGVIRSSRVKVKKYYIVHNKAGVWKDSMVEEGGGVNILKYVPCKITKQKSTN